MSQQDIEKGLTAAYGIEQDRTPNPEELFLRLEEYLDELNQQAKKEYSS